MKRIQLWYCKRPPSQQEGILFERAEAVVVGYPKTLDGWVREIRSRGVKVLPYISAYKAPEMSAVLETKDWQAGSPARSECAINPFWRAVATDDHPEWIARDEQGRARRPFESEEYSPGWNETSPLVPSYREACVRGLQDLLADGYDGVFLDNIKISGRPPHAGLGSAEDVARAMRSLALELGNLTKPGVFMINGKPDAAVAPVADLYCLESFLFSWAWDLSAFWAEEWQAQWESYRSLAWKPGDGPQPVALGYLGFSGRSLREDAYALMACAWILGMAVCDAGTALDPAWMADFAGKNRFQGGQDTALRFQARTSDGNWLEDFYRLDLGDPQADAVEQEGCLVRRFDRGVCIFNPTRRLVRLGLPEWGGRAYEHACGVEVEAKGGIAPVYVPPFCGRILTAVTGGVSSCATHRVG